MTAPTIDALPTPPSRGEDRITFAEKANDLFDALPDFVTQTNALATWMETDGGLSAVRADTTHVSANRFGAAQSISASSNSFNHLTMKVESYDTRNECQLVNGSRTTVTVQESGFYSICVGLYADFSGASDGDHLSVYITTNDGGGDTVRYPDVRIKQGSANQLTPKTNTTMYLSAGTIIMLTAQSNLTSYAVSGFITVDRLF